MIHNILTKKINEVSPAESSAGAQLIGLYITHQGMVMAPHYIMRKTEAGVYIKITDCSPKDWCMSQGEKEEECSVWLRYAHIAKKCEKSTVVLLKSGKLVRDLEDAIVRAGAFSWDGYNKRKSMKRVADSGDVYRMYMEFSDGAKVNMYGYNCCPKGFKDLLRGVEEIFNSINCS